MYYFSFFLLMLFFIFGNKVCQNINKNSSEEGKVERDLRIAAGLDRQSYFEQYCGMQNQITLNAGAIFLTFAAFRQFYNKYNKKKEQLERR